MGQLLVGQSSHVGPLQVVFSVGRDIQTAQHIHQRGLAGARLTHNGHKLPLVDLEGYPVQGPDLALLALVVYFIEVSDVNEHLSTPLNSHSCRLSRYS